MSITKSAEEAYQSLIQKYDKSSQNLLKGSSLLGNACFNLSVRVSILNQKMGKAPSKEELIDERDAFSIIYFRYKALFQSAVDFGKELQEAVERIDSTTPFSMDEDNLYNKRRRLEDKYAHIGTLRQKIQGQLDSLKNSLKLFHAIVNNQGNPLRYDQSKLASLSLLPPFLDALRRQDELVDKCLEIEKDPLSISESFITSEEDEDTVLLERPIARERKENKRSR